MSETHGNIISRTLVGDSCFPIMKVLSLEEESL